MKTITMVLLIFLPVLWLGAQPEQTLDNRLLDLNGITTSSSEIFEPGTTTLLVFWKTSGSRSCNFLDDLQITWMDTLKDKGLKIVAICTDCIGNGSHVKPFFNGKNWDFDCYIDLNGDLKRSFCVNDTPCAVLLDQNKNLICRYNENCSENSSLVCQNILEQLDQLSPENELKAWHTTNK